MKWERIPAFDPFTGKAPSGAGKYEIKPAIAAKVEKTLSAHGKSLKI